MELFNKFRETVFLKQDSNLEKQIEELKAIRNNVTNKEKLERDLKILQLGLQGEKEIEFELKHANLGMYVIHDITIQHEDLKAQIDYIIVTKGYIYLVECKNLIGNITVDNKGEFQREYELNGKKIKEAIYSPYTQAQRHKEILKKRWISKSNKIIVSLKEKAFDTLWYKPLVVLSNSKCLLNTKNAPKEVRDNTIRVDQLISYIKKDIEKYDRDIMSSRKDMEINANSLLNINTNEYISIANKYQIKNDISDMKNNNSNTKNNNSDIENKLKEFRKGKSKKMNVPAYYIFKDDEMNNIISHMPKDLNELKKLNILPEIKIKLHGEEIIKIINKE